FNLPAGIALEPELLLEKLQRERSGEPPPPITVVVADAGNGVLRRVNLNGEVTTVGATSEAAGSRDRFSLAQAVQRAVTFDFPTALGMDSLGNIYVTEPGRGQVTAILRDGTTVPVAQANTFVSPNGIVVAESGKLIITDSDRTGREIVYGAPIISRIIPPAVSTLGGTVITIMGENFAPDSLVVVAGVVIDDLHIDNTQTITFVAPFLPSGRSTLTVQNRGGLDQIPFRINSIPFNELSQGAITTVAGGSTFIGDGFRATRAILSLPRAMALDRAGNLLVADTENHRVRKIDAVSGMITTVAGTGEADFSGDGDSATAAALFRPSGVAVDAAGNLFIADSQNKRIRKVDQATGIITTVAGTGEADFSGDGGPATEASLNKPRHVAIDAAGHLLITDINNHRVRRVDLTSGIITTVAGNGERDFSGDGGPATVAAMNLPVGLAFDRAGNLFIADFLNQRIRKVDTAGIITTVVGSGATGSRRGSFSGDGGPATEATLNGPGGVALDAQGNLYIVDLLNSRIRAVRGPIP
ncbi:MAG: IPT/TIG domain-containing protein, partial [Acidobacteria bacterium]|nr:IPT/TIG domain-containing protein [Acidobacteriota bacterium]